MKLTEVLQGLVDHCRLDLGLDHVELEVTLPLQVIDNFSKEQRPLERESELPDSVLTDSASVTKMFLDGGTVTLKGK